MSKYPQNVSPDRPLSVKQTKFAAAVASGVSKAQARRENYASSPPQYKKADARKAARMATQPHVAAEIRRLTWLACPPADDIRGMREHAIRVISDLSRTAVSEDVRLKSALALLQIAEHTRAAAAPSATPVEQDRIMDALRKLYGQAQIAAASYQECHQDYAPPPPPPTSDDEVIDIQALGEPLQADTPKP